MGATGGDRLVLRPTSPGINAPHCTTFHIGCNSKNQKMINKINVTRVNSGSLRMNDRSLAGLNCGNVGAIKAMSVELGNCGVFWILQTDGIRRESSIGDTREQTVYHVEVESRDLVPEHIQAIVCWRIGA